MTKAEKTRNFIVAQTAPIFNMKGYAGTSLTDLTEATGLTKGSIYGNFTNKDEVALAVFDYNLSLLQSGINTAIAAGTSSTDKLLKMAHHFKSNFKNAATRGGCPILNTGVEADDTHPQLREKAAQSIIAWKKTIESIIREGIGANEIKPGVNPSDVAIRFIALLEGGILLAKTTGNLAMLSSCIGLIEHLITTDLAT